MSPDYRRVKKEADALLAKYGVTSPPVPIYDMIEDAGVDVKFVQFRTMGDRIAGVTKFDEGTIFVNSEDPMNRQTWTMAHEFGHWLLHRHLFEAEPARYNVLMRQGEGLNTDPLEKEANAFARMVLVPEVMLRQVKSASLIDLSKIFLVSPEAIRQSMNYV